MDRRPDQNPEEVFPTVSAPSPGGVLADLDSQPLMADEPTSAAEAGVPLVWNKGDVVLGLYEVKDIHSGGMGTVYRVRHRTWDMDMAVKSPHAECFRTARHKRHFIHECNTWLRLGLHPNIVSCYYVRMLGGVPRVFTEYVEGGSLAEGIRTHRLYEGGPEAALHRILDFAIQCAWGLAYAHQRGIVHQDVKPANVMLTGEGVAKLTDYGIARGRIHAEGEDDTRPPLSVLVSFGGMTPAFCSPEQRAGHDLGPSTDVWSWGLSVLEMFAGGPFWIYESTMRDGTRAAEALAFLEQTKTVEAIFPRLPELVAGLLKQCFQPEPAARPADMAAVARQLAGMYERILGHPYPRQPPQSVGDLADNFNNRAVSCLDLGRHAEAERLWGRALEAEACHPESTYNLGLLRWRSGAMTDKTLVHQLKQTEGHASADWLPVYLRALVHLECGDSTTAEQLLVNLQHANPGNERILTALATAREHASHARRVRWVLKGHVEAVRAVALDEHGRYAVSVGDDGTVRAWETETGRCLCRLSGPDRLLAVAVTEDGQYALVGGASELKLYYMPAGTVARILLSGLPAPVSALAMTRDGRLAVSVLGANGAAQASMVLWDPAAGRRLGDLEASGPPPSAVGLSRSGALVVSGHVDGTLRLWEAPSGSPRHCTWPPVNHRGLNSHMGGRVTSVCFSHDPQRVLAGCEDGTIGLWDVPSGRWVRTMSGHVGAVLSVALTADGEWAISGGSDRTVRLWHVPAGRCLCTLEGHTGPVYGVALDPEGRLAVTGGHDGAVRVWEMSCQAVPPRAAAIVCRGVSSKTISVVHEVHRNVVDKARQALARGEYALAAQLIRGSRNLPGCRRAPDLMNLWRELYARLPKKSLHGTWEERNLKAHDSRVRWLWLGDDARGCLSVAEGGTVRWWDLESGVSESRRNVETRSPISVARAGVDGKTLFCGTESGSVIGWNVEAGAAAYVLSEHKTAVMAMALSRVAGQLLTGDADGTVRLSDSATGHCVRVFPWHRCPVQAVGFSPDGQHVVTATQGGTIGLWETAMARCVRVLDWRPNEVTAIAWSPDGRFILVGSADGLLACWSVPARKVPGSKFQVPSERLEASSGRPSVLNLEPGTWNLELSWQRQAHTGAVRGVAFMGDGSFALSAGDDASVCFWQVCHKQYLTPGESPGAKYCVGAIEGHGAAVTAVTVSADGAVCVPGFEDGMVYAHALDWELES
jgi:WD40 repeat protein/serine/threonine protein kinase